MSNLILVKVMIVSWKSDRVVTETFLRPRNCYKKTAEWLLKEYWNVAEKITELLQKYCFMVTERVLNGHRKFYWIVSESLLKGHCMATEMCLPFSIFQSLKCWKNPRPLQLCILFLSPNANILLRLDGLLQWWNVTENSAVPHFYC